MSIVPSNLTFPQLKQESIELEFNLRSKTHQVKTQNAKRALEQAAEYIPQILEYLRTAEKEEKTEKFGGGK
jgi:hypothetical protein